MSARVRPSYEGLGLGISPASIAFAQLVKDFPTVTRYVTVKMLFPKVSAKMHKLKVNYHWVSNLSSGVSICCEDPQTRHRSCHHYTCSQSVSPVSQSVSQSDSQSVRQSVRHPISFKWYKPAIRRHVWDNLYMPRVSSFHESSFYLIKTSFMHYFSIKLLKNVRLTGSQNVLNFGVKWSKSRGFIRLRPRPRWGLRSSPDGIRTFPPDISPGWKALYKLN